MTARIEERLIHSAADAPPLLLGPSPLGGGVLARSRSSRGSVWAAGSVYKGERRVGAAGSLREMATPANPNPVVRSPTLPDAGEEEPAGSGWCTMRAWGP